MDMTSSGMEMNALETLPLPHVATLPGMGTMHRHRNQCKIKASAECGKCKKRKEKQRPVVRASFQRTDRKLPATGVAEARQKG